MADPNGPLFRKHQGGGYYTGHMEWTLTDADLTAAGLTEAVSLAGFPADARPLVSAINIGSYFTGTGITDMDVEIGDTADPNGLQATSHVFDVTALGDWTVGGAPGAESKYGATDPLLAYSPEAFFTSVGANLDQADTGQLHVRIYFEQYLPDPS